MDKCAFERDTECLALNVKVCQHCRFFKTREELIESRWKAEARVNALPQKQRSRIFHKYFAKPITRNTGEG